MIRTTTVDLPVEAARTMMDAAADSSAAKALIIAEGTRLCRAAAGTDARAIVLSGSMARGEATLKRDRAGWRALGDATFLIVSEGPLRINGSHVGGAIEQSLRDRGVSCKIAVIASTSAHLRTMQPHIYAYELRERGVVLWGCQDTLRLIPGFAARDIPQEDGWWFLCNRIIEQLESAAEQNSWHAGGTAVQYRIAKLYLAMAACYLLAIGEYLPSYRERAVRLEELAFRNHESAPIPLERFARLVSQCTALKVTGEVSTETDEFPDWFAAVADAEALWRWILARLTDAMPSLSRQELVERLASRQRPLLRAKAWARAAYVSRLNFARNGLHWARLAYTTSPRYLVYGAAGELFFASRQPEALTTDEVAKITARLPLRLSERPRSWRDAVTAVATNFHLLLESNRS